MANIDWIAILLSSLVPLVLGAVWYNPKVFGAIMNSENDLKKVERVKSHHWSAYPLAWLFSLLASFFLLQMINHGGVAYQNFIHGSMHGTLLGLMVALPVLATHLLFEGFKFKYIVINVAYWMISFMLMGGILGGLIS